MSPQSSPSGDSIPPRLNELANLMRSCRTTSHELSDSFHWQPAAGSQADIDRAALDGFDQNSTADGITAGFTLLSEVVVSFLEIAAGHLTGMAALYDTGEVFFPPLPAGTLDDRELGPGTVGPGNAR